MSRPFVEMHPWHVVTVYGCGRLPVVEQAWDV